MTAVSLKPVLSVRNGKKAAAFYVQALGAEEIMRVESPDGEIVAELSIGGYHFFIADESQANENFSPESFGGTTVRMGLIVPDPDILFRQALEAGAVEMYPVSDQPYGYRLGRLKDPFGHHWEIGRPI